MPRTSPIRAKLALGSSCKALMTRRSSTSETCRISVTGPASQVRTPHTGDGSRHDRPRDPVPASRAPLPRRTTSRAPAIAGPGKKEVLMDRKWWTLGVVCAATFMLLLDVTIVVVALPDIQSKLGASFSEVQWVTDAYALSLAALLLTCGALADRYGRKRLFLVGMVVFTLGSVLCGAAQDPTMLVLSRAAQGIGGAMLFATSLALLATSFQGRERGVAFGIWGAVTGISTALGPILGGAITSGFSWRGVFWVNLP